MYTESLLQYFGTGDSAASVVLRSLRAHLIRIQTWWQLCARLPLGQFDHSSFLSHGRESPTFKQTRPARKRCPLLYVYSHLYRFFTLRGWRVEGTHFQKQSQVSQNPSLPQRECCFASHSSFCFTVGILALRLLLCLHKQASASLFRL